MKSNNKLLLWLRILISIVLLFILCYFMRNRFDELLDTIRSVNIGLFLLSLTVASCIIVIHAFRLKFLFEIQKIYFSGAEAIRLAFVGVFFNNFIPSTIGGDIVKLYYAKKRAKNFIGPLSSLMMDRIMGLAALILLGIVALLLKSEFIKNNLAKLIIMSFFLIIIGLFILLFFKGFSSKLVCLCRTFKLVKTERWIVKLVDAVSRFSKSSKTLNAFFFGVLGHVLSIFCVYLLSRSLSLDVPIATFYVLVPVIQIVSVLPSINGLGVREGAFVYFFKDFMSPECALAISILFIGLMVSVSIAGGFIYMFYGRINTKEVVA